MKTQDLKYVQMKLNTETKVGGVLYSHMMCYIVHGVLYSHKMCYIVT